MISWLISFNRDYLASFFFSGRSEEAVRMALKMMSKLPTIIVMTM